MHLRSENAPLCGRDHLSYRSYFFPVKVCVSSFNSGPILVAILDAIFFSWWMWTSGEVTDVHMKPLLHKRISYNSLVCIYQKKKIAPKPCSKNRSIGFMWRQRDENWLNWSPRTFYQSNDGNKKCVSCYLAECYRWGSLRTVQLARIE